MNTAENPRASELCRMAAAAGGHALACDLPVRARRHALGQHHDPDSGLIWSAHLAAIMTDRDDLRYMVRCQAEVLAAIPEGSTS